MRGLVAIGLLALLVAGSLVFDIADTTASIADTGIHDNEVASSASESNSPHSVNATTTITMRTAPLPEEYVGVRSHMGEQN